MLIRSGVATNPSQPPPRGFEPLSQSSQGAENATLTNTDGSDLAFCLARLVQQDPELRAVIDAWAELPDAVRAGIVAMVRVTGNRA